MGNEIILVVDDEPEILELLDLYLSKEGYTVVSANNGDDALRMVHHYQPDLVILDIVLPGQSGLKVCQELRKHSIVPILFISCRDDEVDKVMGLELGGDDYITKPFSPKEVVARVRAHLRRHKLSSTALLDEAEEVIRLPDLIIDVSSYKVEVNEEPIPLTAKEFELLAIMASNPNQVFSADQLFDLVWKERSLGDARTVIVHISNLRKKIEQDPSTPKYIQTVRGVGYKFAK